MKKILFALIITITGASCGAIKNQVDFINKNTSVTMRIEKKIDLILAQYIKAEAEAEKRAKEESESKAKRDKQIAELKESAKEGYEKSKTWLEKKKDEMMESELILKVLNKDSNESE